MPAAMRVQAGGALQCTQQPAAQPLAWFVQ